MTDRAYVNGISDKNSVKIHRLLDCWCKQIISFLEGCRIRLFRTKAGFLNDEL